MESEKVIYGIHPVLEALKSNKRNISKIILAYEKKGLDIEKVKTLAKKRHIKVSQRDKKRIDELAGTSKHQGVVAVVTGKSFEELEDLVSISLEKSSEPLLLILDGITDPHNLGAVLRSAEALGVEGVILPKDRAAGITPAVAKTSAGALEHIRIARVTNLARTLEYLKDKGFWIVGADEKAHKPLYEKSLSGPLGIIMGSEEEGIRRLIRKKCDFFISIPMKGEINSLNVSTASAIIIYEILRQKIK